MQILDWILGIWSILSWNVFSVLWWIMHVLPSDNKLLPERKFTKIFDAIWRHYAMVFNSLRPSNLSLAGQLLTPMVQIMAWSATSHYLNQYRSGDIVKWALETNFSECLIEFHKFSFQKMRLKCRLRKRRPLCQYLNVTVFHASCQLIKYYHNLLKINLLLMKVRSKSGISQTTLSTHFKQNCIISSSSKHNMIINTPTEIILESSLRKDIFLKFRLLIQFDI